MTGEVLAWYRVGARLGIPVEEIRSRITRREFLDWLLFLDWEEQRVTKLDHYLAQIAAEVVRAPLVKATDRRRVKRDDYLVRFVKPTEEQKDKVAKSKANWGMYLGAWKKAPMKMQIEPKTEKKEKAHGHLRPGKIQKNTPHQRSGKPI